MFASVSAINFRKPRQDAKRRPAKDLGDAKSMELQLHRVLDYWCVGEYPLRLVKDHRGWLVRGQITEIKAHQWLEEIGLGQQSFTRRSDALQALQVALTRPDAPLTKGPPYYRPIEEGVYQLTGDFLARPSHRPLLDHQSRWQVWEQQYMICYAATLWRAAWIAQNRAQHYADIDHAADAGA